MPLFCSTRFQACLANACQFYPVRGAWPWPSWPRYLLGTTTELLVASVQPVRCPEAAEREVFDLLISKRERCSNIPVHTTNASTKYEAYTGSARVFHHEYVDSG